MTSNLPERPQPPSAPGPRMDLAPGCTVFVDKPRSHVFLEHGIVRFENTNVLVRIRTSELRYEPHIGPLSILFASNGQENCWIDGRHFVIDDTSYVVQNLGQKIAGEIDSSVEVDSYVLGFWPGFAEEVLRTLVSPADSLLDDPGLERFQPVQFFNQSYRHDRLLSPVLFRMRAALENDVVTHGWLEEQNHLLLERLLAVHRSIRAEVEALPAVRASTRAEYYQRLHRARDFMEANLDRPVSLSEIAGAAWLSPHHFLRLFKQMFAETPHQYLTRRRLERAQHLLTRSDLSVTDICFAVGFESLGSFSWLFRKRVGVSPEQFRHYHTTQRLRK